MLNASVIQITFIGTVKPIKAVSPTGGIVFLYGIEPYTLNQWIADQVRSIYMGKWELVNPVAEVGKTTFTLAWGGARRLSLKVVWECTIIKPS
jgi:hypothetical protein